MHSLALPTPWAGIAGRPPEGALSRGAGASAFLAQMSLTGLALFPIVDPPAVALVRALAAQLRWA